MNKAQTLQKAINDAYLGLDTIDRTLFPVAVANITLSVNAAAGSISYVVTMPVDIETGTNGELVYAAEDFIPA